MPLSAFPTLPTTLSVPTHHQPQGQPGQQQQQPPPPQQQQQGVAGVGGGGGQGVVVGLPYPALYLYPLNDSFVPKHIALNHGQHVKIGRQTNAKTAPGERNGYFDSKVLSRQHAEVWEEAGKIFIKDVKSSNGTFINGERLSSEAQESDPYELKSDDIVEFGIDIVGEDNKTIIHHKVAARVICVFTEQDAQVAARAEQHQQQHAQQQQQQQQQYHQGGIPGLGGQAGPSGLNGAGGGAPSGFNFNANQQRRPQMAQPSLGGMGGMGGGMRPPGKSGLTFDVILSRLQGELQKSRETGAELNTLTGAMGEIHDSLSGGLPANLPTYPSVLPPVRPAEPPPAAPSPPSSESGGNNAGSAPPTVVLTDLQSQLRDTQTTLAGQLDKIRALEAVLAEQETVKGEVRALREMIDERRREVEEGERVRRERVGEEEEPKGGFDLEDEELELDVGELREGEEGEDDDEDDDARSVSSVATIREREVVIDEDEERVDPELDFVRGVVLGEGSRREQQEREREREEERSIGRPGTPEPTSLGLRDGMRVGSPLSGVNGEDASLATNLNAIKDATIAKDATNASKDQDPTTNGSSIHEQLAQLTAQVTAVMQLTTTLEAQHLSAQSTIRGLESKVGELEALIRTSLLDRVKEPNGSSKVEEKEEVTKQKEEKQKEEKEREDGLTERISAWMKAVDGKWSSVQQEWSAERERLNKAREEWEARVRRVDEGIERIERVERERVERERSVLTSSSYAGLNGDAVKHGAHINGHGLVTPPSPRSQSSDSGSGRYRRRRRRSSSGSRGRSRSRSFEREGEEGEAHSEAGTSVPGSVLIGQSQVPSSRKVSLGESGSGRALVTPEPSVYKVPIGPGVSGVKDGGEVYENAKEDVSDVKTNQNNVNVQTAVGVLFLSVAAAAVIWRVKPET